MESTKIIVFNVKHLPNGQNRQKKSEQVRFC